MNLRLVVLILGTAASGGCSLAFVQGPPDDYLGREEIDCTESRVIPFLDLGLGITAAATARVESVSPETGETEVQVGQTIALAAISGGLFALSSVGGFRRVSACRAAKKEASLRAGAAFGAIGPRQEPTFAAPSLSSIPLGGLVVRIPR